MDGGAMQRGTVAQPAVPSTRAYSPKIRHRERSIPAKTVHDGKILASQPGESFTMANFWPHDGEFLANPVVRLARPVFEDAECLSRCERMQRRLRGNVTSRTMLRMLCGNVTYARCYEGCDETLHLHDYGRAGGLGVAGGFRKCANRAREAGWSYVSASHAALRGYFAKILQV